MRSWPYNETLPKSKTYTFENNDVDSALLQIQKLLNGEYSFDDSELNHCIGVLQKYSNDLRNYLNK